MILQQNKTSECSSVNFGFAQKHLDHVEYSITVEYSTNYENSYFSGKSRFFKFSAYFTSILMILHQKKHFECSSANFGSGQKISDHVEYSIGNFDFSQKSLLSR